LITPNDTMPNIYFLFKGKLKKSKFPPEEQEKVTALFNILLFV
jgi:hypothetical protein